MCEPVTIMMGVAAVMGAASNIQQGKARAIEGEYNAQIAEIRAQDAIEQGDVNLAKHRRQVAAVKGRQVASAAAQGVDVSTGSAANIIEETMILGELDAQVIRRNAEMTAAGLSSQADMSRFGGQSARRNSNIAAGATLIGGAAKTYAQYYGE